MATQGKKRAEFIFGAGKGQHESWSYQMYHEEDGQSVWYGLWGLQGVGVDEVPKSVMNAFLAWMIVRKSSDVGDCTKGALRLRLQETTKIRRRRITQAGDQWAGRRGPKQFTL